MHYQLVKTKFKETIPSIAALVEGCADAITATGASLLSSGILGTVKCVSEMGTSWALLSGTTWAAGTTATFEELVVTGVVCCWSGGGDEEWCWSVTGVAECGWSAGGVGECCCIAAEVGECWFEAEAAECWFVWLPSDTILTRFKEFSCTSVPLIVK